MHMHAHMNRTPIHCSTGKIVLVKEKKHRKETTISYLKTENLSTQEIRTSERAMLPEKNSSSWPLFSSMHTCFKIKHLNEHECDVHTSHSKWIFPHRSITFLLPKEILEGFLHWDVKKHISINKERSKDKGKLLNQSRFWSKQNTFPEIKMDIVNDILK